MTMSTFFSRNVTGRESVAPYIRSADRKNFQPGVLYPEKLSFIVEGQIKIFPDEQKIKKFITKPVLTRNVKGMPLSWKKAKGKGVAN